MATGKRKSIHTNSSTYGTSSLNFRPNATTQEDRGGTRPTGEPHSISFVMLSLVLHICKKLLLFDTTKKIGVYFCVVFFFSIIADIVPVPKLYISRSDNFVNYYFIKWGWAWLLLIAAPWITMVAQTVGCGRRSYLIKHLSRLIIATIVWKTWMILFQYVERKFGYCIPPTVKTRTKCLENGFFWSGLDISGHTFIIIYTTLILAEEGAAFIGWEKIRDSVRNEKHTRTIEGEISNSSLRSLSYEDLEFLGKAHNKFSPYLRGLFIIMTLQMIIWDISLISTVLYYHNIVEKLLGMAAAVVSWYFTYHILFQIPKIGLLNPGDGLFKYIEQKKEPCMTKSRRSISNRNQGPTFIRGLFL